MRWLVCLAFLAAGVGAAYPLEYDAVVDARHPGADGARVDGVPTYRTLGAALAGVAGTESPTLFLRNGRYREKLTVAQPGVTLRGESRDGVVITYDAASGSPRPEGGTWGTRGSYTLRVTAPDFTAEHLTIENAFDYAANAARAEGDPARLASPQAVALMTDSASDRAVFRDVRIRGAQDTLFPNAGRHYFHGCVIEGHVDFVFGTGTAVFEECEIVSLDRGRPDNGYVTAASTALAQPYGFVFLRSRLRKGSPAMADGSVALGRPWHPSADRQAVGSVAFIDCWMDGHVSARGWEPMSSVDSTGTRVWFQPEDARLFEYRSTGPGAVASTSRRQLTDAQAAAYAPELVLAGWRPGPATDGR